MSGSTARKCRVSRSTWHISTRGSPPSSVARRATSRSRTWRCTPCPIAFTSPSNGAGERTPAQWSYGSTLWKATSAEVALRGVPVSEVILADAPDPGDDRLDVTLPLGSEGEEMTFGDRTIRILRQPIRTSTITDMAYIDGELLVAGLSNEEFSSKLRRIPFPFSDGAANNLEIFHVSHGKWETAAPIRAFVPYDGGRSILASYTCTPVVHFDLEDLQAGTKVVGRTVAELGAMNQPLDMVSFSEGGEEHLLVANSRHGLIKIDCADIDGQEPLTQPHEPVGVPRETKDLQGITRLANLDPGHVLALQRDDDGHQHLRTLKTASL